ncbi:unnamed protein product [Amoebophrya sp. A25]|nr:unnamed protein product [Amoebophrya sp. A25]|eukprot:GSA25T00001937001.1
MARSLEIMELAGLDPAFDDYLKNNAKEGAAIRIQALLRGASARRDIADELAKHNAATNLQAFWRGSKARRDLRLPPEPSLHKVRKIRHDHADHWALIHQRAQQAVVRRRSSQLEEEALEAFRRNNNMGLTTEKMRRVSQGHPVVDQEADRDSSNRRASGEQRQEAVRVTHEHPDHWALIHERQKLSEGNRFHAVGGSRTFQRLSEIQASSATRSVGTGRNRPSRMEQPSDANNGSAMARQQEPRPSQERVKNAAGPGPSTSSKSSKKTDEKEESSSDDELDFSPPAQKAAAKAEPQQLRGVSQKAVANSSSSDDLGMDFAPPGRTTAAANNVGGQQQLQAAAHAQGRDPSSTAKLQFLYYGESDLDKKVASVRAVAAKRKSSAVKKHIMSQVHFRENKIVGPESSEGDLELTSARPSDVERAQKRKPPVGAGSPKVKLRGHRKPVLSFQGKNSESKTVSPKGASLSKSGGDSPTTSIRYSHAGGGSKSPTSTAKRPHSSSSPFSRTGERASQRQSQPEAVREARGKEEAEARAKKRVAALEELFRDAEPLLLRLADEMQHRELFMMNTSPGAITGMTTAITPSSSSRSRGELASEAFAKRAQAATKTANEWFPQEVAVLEGIARARVAAEHRWRIETGAASVIQRCYRGWRARRRLNNERGGLELKRRQLLACIRMQRRWRAFAKRVPWRVRRGLSVQSDYVKTATDSEMTRKLERLAAVQSHRGQERRVIELLKEMETRWKPAFFALTARRHRIAQLSEEIGELQGAVVENLQQAQRQNGDLVEDNSTSQKAELEEDFLVAGPAASSFFRYSAALLQNLIRLEGARQTRSQHLQPSAAEHHATTSTSQLLEQTLAQFVQVMEGELWRLREKVLIAKKKLHTAEKDRLQEAEHFKTSLLRLQNHLESHRKEDSLRTRTTI